MVDETFLEQELNQFARIKKVVIDSSTAIRLAEFELLELLTQLVPTYVLPSVQMETGPELYLQTQSILISYEEDIRTQDLTTLSTDNQLIGFAKAFSCAILSEDRRILQKAELVPIPGYPFGLVLGLMVYKRSLTISEARRIWNRFDQLYEYRNDFRRYCIDLLDYLERSI
jgi:hypothetical protein